MSVESSRELIQAKCRELEELLVAKNASYGDSALNPIRVFSRASASEQLKVRLDDKLSRLSRGNLAALPTESLRETLKDFAGYSILLLIALDLEEADAQRNREADQRNT